MDRRIPLRSRAPLYAPDTSQFVISTQPSIGGKRVRRKKPVKDRGVKRSRYYTRAAKSGKIVFDTKEARIARNLYSGRRQTGGRQTYAQQAANEVGRQALGQQQPQQPPIIINQGEANVANERLVNLVEQGFKYVAEQNRQEPNIQLLRRQQRPIIEEGAGVGVIRLPDRPAVEQPAAPVGQQDVLVEPQTPAPVEPLLQEVEQEPPTAERGGDRRYELRDQQRKNYAESEQSSGDSEYEEVQPVGRLNRSGAKKVKVEEAPYTPRQLAEQDYARERARLEQRGLIRQQERRDLDKQLAEEEEGLRQAVGDAVALLEASDKSIETDTLSENPIFREAEREGELFLEEQKKARRGQFLREAVSKGVSRIGKSFRRHSDPEGAVFFDNPFEDGIIDRGRGIGRVNPLQDVGGLESGGITYNPAASLSGISFDTDSQDIAFD